LSYTKGKTTPPVTLRTSTLPSLHPSYIPYKAQHLILNESQRLLEESCFEFVQTWLPAILEEENCDCACAIELAKWTRLLAENACKLPKGALQTTETQLNDILPSIKKLRKTATYRLAITAREILDLVEASVALAAGLGDLKRARQLGDLCYDLEDKIRAMEMNKNARRTNTMAALDEIGRRREELDRQEKELISTMIKDDAESKAIIGMMLEHSVGKILSGADSEDGGAPYGEGPEGGREEDQPEFLKWTAGENDQTLQGDNTQGSMFQLDEEANP
jgi:outer membrane murein-binding lipoprotein Lpp